MSSQIPPRLPKDVITLLTVMLVVLLVSFPASSSQVAALILVGGTVFILLSSRHWQQRAQDATSSSASLQATALATLAAQKTRDSLQTSAAKPAVSDTKTQAVPSATQHTTATDRPNQRSEEQRRVSAKQENGPSTVATVFDSKNTPEKRQEASPPTTEPKQKSVSPAGSAALHKQPPSAGQPLAGGAAVLARLRQQRAQGNKLAAEAAKREAQAKDVIIAYASQTGTAQEIAKGIQAESAGHGIKSKVMSLNELGFDKAAGGEAPVMVIIASSTGDGDAPDNAAVFYATMRRRTQPAGILKGIKFTCLGLGDSNYTRFMGVSRALRSRLQELGAEPFYKMGEADEVDGIENIVDPWIENLWAPLKAVAVGQQAANGVATPHDIPKIGPESAPKGDAELVGVPALAACRVSVRWLDYATDTTGSDGREEEPSPSALAVRDPEGAYSPAEPFWASITAASYLTNPSSDRKVLHLELDLADSGIEYRPGDSLGVMPVNDDTMVDALLKRLDLDGQRKLDVVSAENESRQGLLPHLGCPCTVRKVFQAGVDVTTAPRKSLLRLLGEHCSHATERRALLHLSSRGGKEAYAALLAPDSPSLLDLLRRFPSCRPPLAALLDALPPLAPRLYSVSSSPLETPGRAHIAFSVVRIGSPPPNLTGGESNSHQAVNPASTSNSRWGVATGWLERRVAPLLAGDNRVQVRIPIFLRKGGAFGLPADLQAPILMIGPGTGVTPFRGFLQHRRHLLRARTGDGGPAILYFGCRRASEDFLYQSDLESFAADGTLSRLELAYSREGPEKIYVQHRMKDQAEGVFPLISAPNAHIFVCGDGAKMAKDVHAALCEILEQQGGMAPAEATAHLAAMTKEGRYIRDIWS